MIELFNAKTDLFRIGMDFVNLPNSRIIMTVNLSKTTFPDLSDTIASVLFVQDIDIVYISK